MAETKLLTYDVICFEKEDIGVIKTRELTEGGHIIKKPVDVGPIDDMRTKARISANNAHVAYGEFHPQRANETVREIHFRDSQ